MASSFGRGQQRDSDGTRVFVSGIPDSVDWMELKDHFKICGNVAYASVSIDRETGQPKGVGIVQYESPEEAQHAIKTIRDHPLRGQVRGLYVVVCMNWSVRSWSPVLTLPPFSRVSILKSSFFHFQKFMGNSFIVQALFVRDDMQDRSKRRVHVGAQAAMASAPTEYT